MRKYLRNDSGQSIVLVALTILVLALFSFMVVSIGQLTYTRIRMQNASDAAALTAARLMARSLNNISRVNLLMNGVVTRVRMLGREGYFVNADVLPAFRAARTALTAAVRAGSGGFVSWGAREAAIRNGAEGILPGLPPTMLSLQLQAQRGNPWVYRIVKVAGVPIPLPAPPFRAGNGTIMYARRWEPSLLRAQPPHRARFIAFMTAPAPFAAALFRGIRTRGTRVQAMSEARVWLDVRPDAFVHNGGFLRVHEQRWWEGIGIQSFWPQFNASLTNITLTGNRDNPAFFH